MSDADKADTLRADAPADAEQSDDAPTLLSDPLVPHGERREPLQPTAGMPKVRELAPGYHVVEIDGGITIDIHRWHRDGKLYITVTGPEGSIVPDRVVPFMPVVRH